MIGRFFLAVACLLATGCSDEAEPLSQPRSEAASLEPTADSSPPAEFEPDAEQIAKLRALLTPDYADFREFFPDSPTPPAFRAAAYDLTGDGQEELLVRLEGRTDCGSGGCTFRVYRQTAGGLEKVSGSTLTHLPIGVAAEETQGWRDIVVTVRGDYVEGGKVRLRYADGTYPLNPTTAPAEPADELGQVVLSDRSQVHRLVD